ncbi:MAG: DUF433 domain-containing protein [Thermoanaerobaculia bacterium]
MATKAKGIRISDQLDREITNESETRGKSWSAITNELLEEAIRMRRTPGIVFVDGVTGRRAALPGGLDVWEIIATWLEGGRSYAELRKNYPWLTETQLRAALAYYELYPSEIDARLEREARWTPERVGQELPFLKPRNR